jgi:hypothetical protein
MNQRVVNGQGTSLLARVPEIIPITATVLAWLALLVDSPAVGWSTIGGPAGAHDGHGGVFTFSGVAMVGTMTIAMGLHRNGSGAIVDSARFGMSHASSGFRTCALPMLAMLTLPGSLPFMGVLTVLVTVNSMTQGRHRVVIAASYAVLGIGSLGVALLS